MNKPDTNSTLSFRLPDQAVIELKGPDAVKFAQAQFMNDVTALTDSHWQWNGWLTPKGRVIALFALLRRDPETLWMVTLDADAQTLMTRLRQFLFRAKLKIEPREDLHVNAQFAAPLRATGATSAVLEEGAVELDAGGAGGARRLFIGTQQAGTDAGLQRDWAAFDLAHGLPRLGKDQSEQWTPQQLSLDRLSAYSVRKGCYPGQEIVARTHFLGQVKRGLMCLQGANVAELDEVMAAASDDGVDTKGPVRALGQMICAVGDKGLAVMPTDASADAYFVDGAVAHRLPLLDGLRR